MSLETLQRRLADLSVWLDRLLVAACIGLLATIFFSVFTGVIIRYVVMVPWPWTEEVARFCLVWFAPLAAAIGARKGLHFSFQWGVMAFTEQTRIAVRQAMNVVTLAFLGLLLDQSIGFLDVMSNQTAMATELNMRVPAYGIVVGVSVLIVVYGLELADAALALFTRRHLSLRELQEAENVKVLQSARELGSIEPALEPVLVQK
jgi:TRAP-type C4-dicarboxylate transport system permease small subunit